MIKTFYYLSKYFFQTKDNKIVHNKQTNHFTLKNVDKRISTTRSLAPKKVRGTAKNVIDNESDSGSDKE
jgi:hypothetical protein